MVFNPSSLGDNVEGLSGNSDLGIIKSNLLKLQSELADSDIEDDNGLKNAINSLLGEITLSKVEKQNFFENYQEILNKLEHSKHAEIVDSLDPILRTNKAELLNFKAEILGGNHSFIQGMSQDKIIGIADEGRKVSSENVKGLVGRLSKSDNSLVNAIFGFFNKRI